MLFPKVPTGIPGLDPLIGGGYTKNSLITVSGGTGSGRTTFAAQFPINGYLQNQEPGLYLSFDEPKFSIFANMSSFRWDLPGLERDKHVVFIEYPHMELANFLEQEGSILELVDTLGVERVVFDSITPLALLSEGDDRRRYLQKLVNVIRRWGVTTLITADDLTPLDPHLPRTDVGVEALTDGYIHLGMQLHGSRRIRTLEVMKMRGSAHAHFVHRCHIDANGFELTGVVPEKPEFGDEPAAPMRPGAKEAPRIGVSSPSALSSKVAVSPAPSRASRLLAGAGLAASASIGAKSARPPLSLKGAALSTTPIPSPPSRPKAAYAPHPSAPGGSSPTLAATAELIRKRRKGKKKPT